MGETLPHALADQLTCAVRAFPLQLSLYGATLDAILDLAGCLQRSRRQKHPTYTHHFGKSHPSRARLQDSLIFAVVGEKKRTKIKM